MKEIYVKPTARMHETRVKSFLQSMSSEEENNGNSVKAMNTDTDIWETNNEEGINW